MPARVRCRGYDGGSEGQAACRSAAFSASRRCFHSHGSSSGRRDAGGSVGQPGLWVDVFEAGCCDQCEHDGGPIGAALRTGEGPGGMTFRVGAERRQACRPTAEFELGGEKVTP